MSETVRVREERKDVYYPNVEDTQIIDGFNIRIDYGDLSELVTIFKETPHKIPPTKGYKKDGKYVITDGHRRRTAALIAAEELKKELLAQNPEATEFPVVKIGVLPEGKGYNDLERVTDMFLFNEGKKLTLLEQAEGVRRFIEQYSLNEHDVAKRIHKSITYVRNCIKLKKAPDDIQKLMQDELISPTLVITMFKEYDLDEAVQIIRDTLSNVQTEPKPKNKPQMTMDFDNEPADTHPLLDADNSSRFAIAQTDQVAPIVEENVSAPKQEPRKITKKDIEDNLKKFNSIALMKKAITRSERDVLDEERAEEFAFISRLFSGDVSQKEINERYFLGKEETED